MKHLLISLFCFIQIINAFTNQTSIEILKTSIDRMAMLERIEYQLYSKISQGDKSYLDTVQCYFDFNNESHDGFPIFQFISSIGEQGFDGKMYYDATNSDKKVLYDTNPDFGRLNSSIFIVNSIFQIKDILSNIILDSSINIFQLKDTIVDNQSCYHFKFHLKDKFYGYYAIRDNEGEDQYYDLLLSKNHMLPINFKESNPSTNRYYLAKFKNINPKPNLNVERFNYDKYSTDYNMISFEERDSNRDSALSNLLYKKAPDFILPSSSKDTIHLSELRGSIVLLDFWFIGCGHCIHSIPTINEIYSNYKTIELNVFGIEYQKANLDKIENYIKKYNLSYPVLYAGENVAKEYGIKGAPTFILIDKSGQIVYISLGLKQQDLINKINEYL